MQTLNEQSGHTMRQLFKSDVRRLPLLVTLAALAMPLAVHSQTIGNVRIGPADSEWAIKPSLSGGLIFDIALDGAGQHCTVNIDGGRIGSGDAATDFDKRWKELVGPDSVGPTTQEKAHASGWTSLFGERAGRTSKGVYRTLALFTITNGSRTQSVVAWANDERCLSPLKALLRTVTVGVSASNTAGASRAASSIASDPASSSSSSANPLRPQDLIGRWYGLKTVQGITLSGGAGTLMRKVEFLADGTYVSEEPNFRGRYQIQGNTVTLPNLYILTFKNDSLSDGYGVLTRKSR